jgi:dihydrofolate reductase
MISAIVAVDYNWGIGFNGDLLEHIPEDLKYFKQLTTGNTVIMGRKTWDSLPNKPLPNRTNIVITNNTNMEGQAEFMDLTDAMLYFIYNKNDDIFIIGGGKIYEELLPMCNRVYVTKIFKDHDQVDTYFPNLDESKEWAPAACSDIRQQGDLMYQFW